MSLEKLDHVNLRTARLQPMTDFYVQVLGMSVGPRPPFPFGGAWLYAGGQPCVHLVEVQQQPETAGLTLEHFAFQASGLGAFLERLRTRGVAYEIAVVPGYEIIQVNVHDPDGNHIHVDFQPHEREALSHAGPATAGLSA